MNDEPTVPGRQIVRAPPIGTIASRPMPDVSDLSAGGRYGDVLVNGLIRAQLGLTLGFLALTAALIGTLPLVAALWPRADHLTLGGLPLPLLVLGAGIYPVLVSLGFLYVHLAERLERRFAELLERRS
jgi:hypothetical protein